MTSSCVSPSSPAEPAAAACRKQRGALGLRAPAGHAWRVDGERPVALFHSCSSIPLARTPDGKQAESDRGENVTLFGVVGAYKVFDKPCRIVPGITGP
jgi:hypothetical protein